MSQNFFGKKIYSFSEILSDRIVSNYIQKTLLNVFAHLGLKKKNAEEIMGEFIALAANSKSEGEYESLAHALLEQKGIVGAVPKKLSGRADKIYSQIKEFVIFGKVLDLGCGDGEVGKLCSLKNEVILSDIYKNKNIAKTGLGFRIFGQGEKVPADDCEFSNVLLLTVLHHSDNPLQVLKEAVRVAKSGGRIIVIESVYGASGKELGGKAKKDAENYCALNLEQQRKAGIFFDHFYNRVIHYSAESKTKVNVPFNFNTPLGWKKLFEENGLVQEKAVHLGIDQPIVPEYHTLHVLRKV
ncbi:Methyltransferase domain protein [uncultured archaeon]|nr:Methyltransferase domain protein [uncultured archaeon]